MIRYNALAVTLTVWLAAGASAADTVNVGSANYPGTTSATIGGKAVNLVLTGAAMRQKLVFNVYAIASYIQAGADVRGAAGVAAADVPKQLHLVMQRDVSGQDIAESFRSAIRANHAEPAFNAEVEELVRMLRAGTARRGDQIVLTHVPGVGLNVSVSGKDPFFIKNAGFSRAVWDIYLGPNNIGESVKRGLISRL